MNSRIGTRTLALMGTRGSAFALRTPPQMFFVVSAIFHYLGPAFAVLLFASIEPLGVAWLRSATAALVFALWRRPWRFFFSLDAAARRNILMLGAVLALMNASFYLAIDRLPLGTVAAIEFLGPITLAAIAVRSLRNLVALTLAAAGVYLLVDIRIVGEPVGLALAFLNCLLFVFYLLIGHRISRSGGVSGIDRLAAAMIVAMIAALPIGFADALPAFSDVRLLGAAIVVGISSSVIPYVCDQLAMARLPRATFALLLSLLPAVAVIIGVIVLRQIPAMPEMIGVAMVVLGVGIHRAAG